LLRHSWNILYIFHRLSIFHCSITYKVYACVSITLTLFCIPVFIYIYTSIFIASISFTGRMKFIPRWTPLALSPRKGTENTNDARNSPLFLECCYFKIASTRCKAILIAFPNKYRILNTDLGFYCLLVFTQFMYSLIKKRLLKSINRLKRGHNRRKTNKF